MGYHNQEEIMDLNQKVAIVTGSGRGIGQTIALKLASLGATIVINDIGDPASVEDVVNEIKAMDRECSAVLGDVSSSSDVDELVRATVDTFGRVDILVNNAGITRDHLVIPVNLRSVFLCTRAVLRHMTRQRWGRIINMASVVGIAGNAGQANYAAAKAGIIGLTKTVAKESASRGVTVNAIAPGFIATQMTEQLDEKWKETVRERIPIGDFGTPGDVAEAVAFLASEEARYITGHVLNVDGGMGGI
jgi:3-oxoacyl-[acyl-carrier protein] reductase